MRHALTPVLVLALAGCGLVAGCGRAGVPPLTWAGSVCAALKPWRDQITGLNAQAAQQMAVARTPRQTRDNLLRLLAGARAASERARTQVAAAGVPGVEGGKTIADRFVASLAAMRDAYGKAYDAIGRLPLGPAEKFYAAVAAAIDILDKEYAQAGVDTTRLASAELRRDFDKAPACTSG